MGFPATVVLGASGRIGRVLRHFWPGLLPARGYDPATTRWQARRAQTTALPEENWVLLDPLAEPEALAKSCSGAEALLCLAGPVPGSREGLDLADHSRLALAAIEALARAAEREARAPAPLFLASSAAVYGRQSGGLCETAEVTPANAYGAAKLAMEQAALARGRALGVPVTALRIGNIAGLDVILGGWTPGFTLDQFADGHTPRRSYIGVQSLAEALAALLQCPRVPPILNLAQPGPVDMGALLRAGHREFTCRPAPEGAIPEVSLDLELLRRTLGQHLMPAPADPACLVAEWSLVERDFHGSP
ncbi:hypothetical protein RSK20926_01277 [Roseobacter sp. SK209-2-6]|uniref:NAD-dependent epimerase/dehydratase family protein n=1 Tax=Roseobacter sp. SK209-2-6 TaxID=388739 RepID=UPI0000F3F1B7|nr:NAD-dependent epimerase/dehydratase family protein [Roseobacter sp. SK209-2-6]EBA14584.1 hypothetical protein RSK20926_01277 [Roseobacter sp. SK209-2-6]